MISSWPSNWRRRWPVRPEISGWVRYTFGCRYGSLTQRWSVATRRASYSITSTTCALSTGAFPAGGRGAAGVGRHLSVCAAHRSQAPSRIGKIWRVCDSGSARFHACHGYELAGPGLRVEAPLRVRTGDRVLVIFQPSGVDVMPPAGEQTVRPFLIEDVGQVRHCRDIDGGTSFAVELAGLNEADIDELVRITNMISAKAGTAGESGRVEAVVAVNEAAMVQGA